MLLEVQTSVGVLEAARCGLCGGLQVAAKRAGVLRMNATLGSARAGHPGNPSARQTAPLARGERARE